MKTQLSKREHEVLDLLLKGYLQKQIAYKLRISESRVQDIKAHIKKKWKVNTDIEFILTAIRLGYLKIELLYPKESTAETTSCTLKSMLPEYSYIKSTSRTIKINF